jgi:hypothetical protein
MSTLSALIHGVLVFVEFASIVLICYLQARFIDWPDRVFFFQAV